MPWYQHPEPCQASPDLAACVYGGKEMDTDEHRTSESLELRRVPTLLLAYSYMGWLFTT